jgi:hypothetical protein
LEHMIDTGLTDPDHIYGPLHACAEIRNYWWLIPITVAEYEELCGQMGFYQEFLVYTYDTAGNLIIGSSQFAPTTNVQTWNGERIEPTPGVILAETGICDWYNGEPALEIAVYEIGVSGEANRFCIPHGQYLFFAGKDLFIADEILWEYTGSSAEMTVYQIQIP